MGLLQRNRASGIGGGRANFNEDLAVTNKKKTEKKGDTTHTQKGKGAGATSAAILGAVGRATKGGADAVPKKIKPEWVKYQENLMDLRERLLNQMNGLAKESAAEMDNYSLHMADSGTDNFDRDFALSLLSSDQDAIYEIEEALKRIERGTYGTCELTAKAIPKARLEAIPWTRFTVEAQAQLEKEGALRARKLGSLRTVDESAAPIEIDDDDEVEEKPAKEKE